MQYMQWIKLLVLLLLLFQLVDLNEAKEKSVTVHLDTKWQSTPILCEISEFVAKESSDFFWEFVQDLSHVTHLDEETDRSVYQLGLKLVSRYISPLQQDFLKLYLSLHIFSPAIHTQFQIAQEFSAASECTAFVEVRRHVTCQLEEVDVLLEYDGVNSPFYKFDHVFPGLPNEGPLVILYGELGTPDLNKFHALLVEKASSGQIQYIFRHHVKELPPKRVRLSGYGVELAIKSTEYKAKDDTKVEGVTEGDGMEMEIDDTEDIQGFNFSTLCELHSDLEKELKEFRNHLLATGKELVPLKAWQLQDLSVQAAQLVLNADSTDALQVLTNVSQNFPTMASTLTRMTVSPDIMNEIRKNQEHFHHHHYLMPGDSALFLNGRSVDMEIYDIFTLLEIMTEEAKLVEGMHSLGAKGSWFHKLLQVDSAENNEENYAVDFRHPAVQYVNNLEDKIYKGWARSVQDLLRPIFPGMLHHIAKNIFHVVFVVNPMDVESQELLKTAESFLVHKVPIRLGIVFAVNNNASLTGRDDAGVALARVFEFIKSDQSSSNALTFITDVYERFGEKKIAVDNVIDEFNVQYPGEDLDLIFGNIADYDDARKAGARFVEQSGLRDTPQVLVNGVPLEKSASSQDSVEENLMAEIYRQTPRIQKAVYQGQLTDRMVVLDWLMEQENVMQRLNSRVLSPPLLTIHLTKNMDGNLVNAPRNFSLLNSKEMAGALAANLKYLTKRDEEALYAASMWVVCDLDTEEGRHLLYNAIKHTKSSSNLRLSLVFNSANPAMPSIVSRGVQVALNTLPNMLSKSFITKLVKEDNYADLISGIKMLQDFEVHGMNMDQVVQDVDFELGGFLHTHASFVSRVVGVNPGQRAVIVNGEVYGPLASDEQFTIEDFALLEKITLAKHGTKISHHIQEFGISGTQGSEMVMRISALLSSQTGSHKRSQVSYKSDKYSVVKIAAANDLPAFTVEAILDPASREAQKLSAFLEVLHSTVNVDITIYMNSRTQLSEIPVTRFYRYIFDPELTFTGDGELKDGPMGHFVGMPQKSLLTLAMDLPESWLVESVSCIYDLDNILLDEFDKSVIAGFELEHLLLEGHCFDATTMQPPRGLQFILGTPSHPAIVDTITMANLGYFQLKASPGLWKLSLREGRSQDIYSIVSHEHTDTPVNSSEVVVAMMSFQSKIINIKVKKRPGQLSENLLQDEEEQSYGLWDSISSSFSGSKAEEEKDETLNIFSIASGHLYERFLRIMMLSVLKNTQTKVKFWFLKNFLSPTFKDFIPYMAKQYDFQYELVQYKWPRWLNQQKEKQRIIWGYKILFLDVLFPLHVKKIIFVDADQIVRANLQELVDLDLGGAPYGYTPFCDSRREMDGFRFWKSGYWRSHLAGRKYHISALYVVDLKKFRRIAAGDRLRGQYQGLSQDPNSLSNLDQDLPNNMIHQVAIKSLPQHWLYCETWCSDEEKARAKTIDLCNNPQTKEPKLQAAVRIVPEWKDYDYEIKVLWDTIYHTNTKDQIEYERPDIKMPDFKVKTEL